MDELLERAARTRDPRFDGWFVTGVHSTRIYCRPSCPSLPARASSLTIFPTAAAAQRHGYRACKRCRPDASPGSPEWSTRNDVVARAVRMIADGTVDREGVAGLAARLGYSNRHVHRLLVAELGAGPLALARSQRATTARQLIESTDLPFTEVAFAAGFVRSLALPGGPAIVGLYPADGAIRAELQLTQLADLTTAVARCRRLLDLDADPAAVVEVLGSDPVIGRLVHANPGRRSPASVDGAEQAVRAVLGQQVSVAAARTVTAKLVATYGSPLPSELVRSAPGSPTHSFPPMDVLAGAEPDLPIPAARRRTIAALAAAVVDRTLSLDIGADRRQAAEALLRLPGVGPWTAAYVSMRALGDPDVFCATDLGVRHALEQLGAATHPAAVSERARAWAPWRSYALHHLWASLDPQEHTR